MEHSGQAVQCRAMEELLDLYVDGALPEETNLRVERHLMRCARCSFEARSIEQARAHLRQAMPPAESSPAFREKMLARLSDEFADVLRPEPAVAGSQRQLPFLLEQL